MRRSLRALSCCALLLLAACRDFHVPEPPAPPNRPTVASLQPSEFFAGQHVQVAGTLFDAGGGETPQVYLGNVAAMVVGLSKDGATGRQVAEVVVPGGLPFGVAIGVRVHTSAGEGSLEATGARYLGPGHLPDRVDVRSSKVGVDPWGLAVSRETMMVVDLWRNLVNVFDLARGYRTQVVALRVPTPGSDPAAASYERAVVDDVALAPEGGQALVSYWLAGTKAGEPGVSGLVALSPCPGGWVPTRHFQLPAGGGRLLRILYGEVAKAFFVERSYGHGGLLTVPAVSLPLACKAGTPPSDLALGLAPQPDPTWTVGDLDEALPGDETTADPGMSISPDGTRLAVSRGYETGSTVDVYDITTNPPAPARPRLYDDSLWIIDVVLYGPDGRLAVLDWYTSTILREAAPPGSGWVKDDIQTAYIVSSMFRGDRDSGVLVATLDSLLEVDLVSGRAAGSIAMPYQTVRALPAPGLSPLMYAAVNASADESGKLVTLNRDAQTITDRWGLEYPIWRAAYSSQMDLAIGESRYDVPRPFVASPGAHFASLTLPSTIDESSTSAVAADRDLLAIAGKRRTGRTETDYVKVLKLSTDPNDVELVPGVNLGIEKRPLYLTPTPGSYLGLAPYGSGVLALKHGSYERVGTGACDQRGPAEWTLPASCSVALPAGWEPEGAAPSFAVAQGSDELLLPQAVASADSTRVAARIPLSGGAPVGLSIAGTWASSMVSVSRDGRLVAVNAIPPCPDDAFDCPAGTAFYELQGAAKPGLQPLPFSALRTTAVAASADATTVYVAQDNGRVYAVHPGLDGVDAYEDIRLLVTLPAGWLTSLSAAGDGASLAGTTEVPDSQLVVLK
ncbi:MAG TPA: hypothetical protein VGK67_08475 [Myxococcales bacterium]|jgi:hypothetical protein